MNKILYIIYDQKFGGSSRHLFDLVTNLDKKKFESIIISIPSPILNKLSKITKTYSVNMKSRIDTKAIAKIKKIIAAEKPDIIHLQSTRAGILGTLSAKDFAIPVIYTEHLFTKDYIPQNKLIHYIQLKTLKSLSKNINTVIAVSNAVKSYLTDKKIFPAEKIKIIYNGISSPLTCLPAGRPLTPYPIIGSIGSLTPLKGYKYLIKAIPEIIKKHPKATFEIIGSGPELMNLQNLAKSLRVNNKIKFWGQIDDHKKLGNIRSKWSVYIQPSLSESFGLSLAEAMSVGIPVIAVNTGGVSELIDNSGILIDKKNPNSISSAIIKLLDDKKLKNNLSKLAQKRIKENFSINKMVKQTERLYQCHFERSEKSSKA